MAEWINIAYLAFAAGVLGIGIGWVGLGFSDDDSDEDEEELDSFLTTPTGFGPDYDPDTFIDVVLGMGAGEAFGQAASPETDDDVPPEAAEPDVHPDWDNFGGRDDWDEPVDPGADDAIAAVPEAPAADLAPPDMEPEAVDSAEPDAADNAEPDAPAQADAAPTVVVFDIDSPEAPAANVSDFDASTDALEIQYSPQTDPDTGEEIPPSVSVSYDSEADVTSVHLNGVEVATLDGAAAISEDDITLTPMG